MLSPSPDQAAADAALFARLPTVEARAREMLARAYGGLHHLPSPLKTLQGAVTYLHYGDLSTVDWDTLTRLVLGAHEYLLRVSISQGGPQSVRVTVSGRVNRDGTFYEKHPTIEQAIEAWGKAR